MSRSLFFSASLLALAPSIVHAQVRPAPKSVLESLAIRQGTVQRIEVPTNDRKACSVRIWLDGELRVLQLEPKSLLSRTFQLVCDDGVKQTVIPTPTEVTYQGRVQGEPNSGVAASIEDGQFAAYIYIGKRDWSVQPLTTVAPKAAKLDHVSYTHDSLLATNVQCGQGSTLDRRFEEMRKRGANPMSSTLQECEIALDCNNYYYRRFGSNTTRTFNAATAQINQVDVIYKREVTICYRIPTILIRTQQVYRNGPQVGCVSGPDLLEEFRTRWRANHTNVHRDVAHMLSAWGRWSGIIGCASVSVVCSTRSGFAVSRVVNSNQARNTGLVAHELGHNWGSGHCNNSPPCYIMCSGIGGCARNLTRFSTYAKNRILAFKGSRTCLSKCCSPAAYSYFGTGCRGSGSGNGVPVLSAIGSPKLGSDFGVSIRNARARAPAIVLHNFGATSLDLSAAGAPGCRLYVQNTFFSSAVVTSSTGTGNFRKLVIPNLSALCGARFYDQAVVLDRANRLGLVFTHRGQPLLGN